MRVTDCDGGCLHAAVAGLVSHTVAVRGSDGSEKRARPVSCDATPMFVVAIANRLEPPTSGITTMPVPRTVAPTAIMSATGVVGNVRRHVFAPMIDVAGSPSLQANPSCTSLGGNGPLALNAITNVCNPLLGIVVRAFNVPVSWLVCGLVVWNEKSPDTGVTGAMPHPMRSVSVGLMIVANAVAGFRSGPTGCSAGWRRRSN